MKNLINKTLAACAVLFLLGMQVYAEGNDTAAFRKNFKALIADAKNGFAINQGEYVSETTSKKYQYYKCKLDLGGSTNIYTQQNSNDSGKVLLCYYDFTSDALYSAVAYTPIMLEEITAMDATWKYRAVDYQEDNKDNVTLLTDLDFNDIVEIISNEKGMTLKIHSKSAYGRSNNVNSNINPLIFPTQQADIRNVIFTPDGKQFVVCSAGKRKRLGMDFIMGGTTSYGLDKKEKVMSDYATISVACSPDGKKFLSSIIADNFRTTTGELREFTVNDTISTDLSKCMQNGANPNAVAYSTDGKTILTTVDGSVFFHDKATQKLLRTIVVRKAEDDYVIDMFLINNDKTLITFNNKVIQYWDVEAGKEIKTLSSENGAFSSCAISADKKTLITNDEKEMIIWDIEKMEKKKSFEAIAPYSSAISPEGSIIACGYRGGIYVYNNSGTMIKKFMRTKKVTFTSLIFSPDGKYLAAGNDKGELVLFTTAELSSVAK